MNTPRPMRIFVVEDDPSVSVFVADCLAANGFAVTTMVSAEQLHWQLSQRMPDAIVLDVSLPGESGLDTCRRLRRAGSRVPILHLTARADDMIEGLEGGADDFMTKPFAANELVARLRALIRRAAPDPAAPVPLAGDIRIGKAIFTPAQRSLRIESQIRVLTTLEYAMLVELVRQAGMPVPRQRLVDVSHVGADATLSRTVDVVMVRLRKLVEPDPSSPRFLQTVRGVGYMFVPAAPRASGDQDAHAWETNS